MISSHKIERKILVSICKDNQHNFLSDPSHQVVPVGASTQSIHPDLALLGVAGPQLEHLVNEVNKARNLSTWSAIETTQIFKKETLTRQA